MKKNYLIYHSVWKIMKFTFYQICLITSVILSSFAHTSKGQSVLDKYINIRIEDKDVKEVLKNIEKQSDAQFVYSSNLIESDRKVSIFLIHTTVGKALEKLLVPLNLKYEVKDKHIILSQIEPYLDPIKVTGKITDEANLPLPGVSVILKGTTRGIATNEKGEYTIEVPNQETVLVYNFLGYKSVEKTVGNQTVLNVQMHPDNNLFDEVVVVGYGQVQKRDLTGSVVSIKEAQITATPVTNALEALQGRVAGMDLTRSSGETGAGLNFNIRGNRSLNASNQPLILVDGIQYGSYIDINPNDIASIEVLKDASSTAIYGSRGANGVILITTKSGKPGKTKVEFNNYFGVNQLTRYQHVTDGEQFIALTREANRAAGLWNSPADDPKIFNAYMDNINRGVNTNWADLMIHDGSVQNNHFAISGGGEKTKFRLSSEYFKEKGLLLHDQLDRFVQHLNLDHKVLNNLNIGAVINFNVSNQQRRNTSFWNLIKNNPLADPYNEDGSIATYPFPGSFAFNPLLDESTENYYNLTKSSRIFMLGFAEWNIVKNLTFRSSFGIDINNSQQGIFEGKNSTQSGVNSGYSRSSLLDRKSQGWTWENVLTHNLNKGRHSLNSMLGSSMISNRFVSFSGEGKDQPFSTALFYNLGTNTRDIYITSSLTESSLESYFGRVNYKYNDKYFLTASLRADGASVLADGNKWAYFPSAAVAWRILDEPFMAGTSKWLNELKLRASYGISGNSAISPYQTQGGLARVAYSWDENPAFGYWPKLLANKDLSWEKTASLNFGLDFALLKNKVTGTLDIYQTRTKDLLMDRILPSLTGYSTTVANVGKTKTRGLDLIISTRNIDRPKFQWSTDFNFATFNEEIVELSVGGDDVSKSWFVGKPLSVFYDFQKIGVWQLNEAEEAAKFSKVPGELKVKDQNGDGLITASDDRVVLGQANPKWAGGITNNFTLGNFSLSVMVYARIGQMIASDYLGYFYANHTAAVVDYWTPENPTNAYPRPHINRTEQYISTLRYADGSFWKIKDIRLSYSLPKKAWGNLPLSNVTLYSTAKNFATFSKIKDYDPERGGSVDFPLTRQLVFGLNVSF